MMDCNFLRIAAIFVAFLAFPHHSTSTPDEALLPGGTPCSSSPQCYSGTCYTEFRTASFCAPDGAVNGTMAGGSACTSNAQCFSNYCYNLTCAPDSRVVGKVASGGMCSSNAQCFSGYCRNGRCRAESFDNSDTSVGYLAAGSECQVHEQCYSGYCHSSRCGPDGRRRNVIPSGGACSHSGQCSSNVCYGDRCSPESYHFRAKGKVANGGRCRDDSHCPYKSHCEDDICSIVPKVKREEGEIVTSPEIEDDLYVDDDDDEDEPVKIQPGAKCATDSDCVASVPCVFGRCSPHSPVNASLVADGGRCAADAQCAAGQCHGEVCSVSYAPMSVTGWVAAGSYCRENRHCFSFLCIQGRCSSDSYADDPHTRRPQSQEIYANRVAAGGTCLTDGDCYSDLCMPGSICSADGPMVRTVAGGATCVIDSDCASGYCFYKRCITYGDTPGRVAPGGRCKTTDMCAPGSMCVDSFCKRPRDGIRRQLIPANSVGHKGACWMDGQCSVGRCLSGKCQAPAYVVERWASKASRGLDHASLMVILISISLLALSSF